MNLAELQAAVYTETNRPDLVAQTLQAVLASTLKMHSIEFFFKDILTAEIVFESALYVQQLDIYTMPRFRSSSYYRKYDPSLLASQLTPGILPPLVGPYYAGPKQTMAELTLIAPDDLFDEWDCEKLDVYYQAGTNIYMKSSTALQYLLAGWYAFPDIAAATFDSWIAREYPYAIVYDAASAILQKTGMTDAARKYDNSNPDNPGLVQTQMNMLRISNVVARGY